MRYSRYDMDWANFFKDFALALPVIVIAAFGKYLLNSSFMVLLFSAAVSLIYYLAVNFFIKDEITLRVLHRIKVLKNP